MYLEKCHGSWLSFILYNSKNLLTSHLCWDTVFGVTCAPGLWPLIFGSRINYLLFPLRWETRFVSAGAPLGKWGVWSVLGGETRDVGCPLKGSSYGCGHQVAAWRWFLASVTEKRSPEFSSDKNERNCMPVPTDRLSPATTESHVGERTHGKCRDYRGESITLLSK